MSRLLHALSLLLIASGAAALGDDRDFTVIDRREVDGTVLVVPRVPSQRPGPDPFVAASAWELRPATEFFRVRSDQLKARAFNLGDQLPVTTFESSRRVANSPVSKLGGSSSQRLEPGEIVRLTGLNTAFKSVRMDLEAVCRRGRDSKRRPRGRVVFVLSGQVNKKRLAEANAAVVAVLEPVGLQQVVRQCDPATGEPPFALRPGLELDHVVAMLGSPDSARLEGQIEILDYPQVRIHFSDGRIDRLILPALD